MIPNVNINNGLRSYEAMKNQAKTKKMIFESSDEFKLKLAERLSKDKIKEFLMNEHRTGPKASKDMTSIGLMKIMLVECQFTGLDQENKSNPMDMITSMTTLDSANSMKASVAEFKLSNQLLMATHLEGKTVEADASTDPILESYYVQNPTERPKVTGVVVNTVKESDKVYVNLNTTPNASKGSEQIMKIEIGKVSKLLSDSNSEIKNLVQDSIQMEQLTKALKEKTIEAFAPLDKEMLELKDYIDPEYRPTIRGEVIDVVKEDTGYYVNIFHKGETVKVSFNDIINP